MKNKLFITFIFVIILGAVVVSLVTKASFVDDLSINEISNYDQYYLSLVDVGEDNPYFKNNLSTFEELMDSSTIVVKAEMTSKRKKVAKATLTTVHVKEVIKGKLQEKEISIYEPAYFFPYIDDPSTGYYSTNGYQLMEEKKEYILFLQPLKAPQGYKLSTEEKTTFLPISELFGKIPIHSDWEPSAVPTNDGEMMYEEIKSNGLLTTENESIQQYIEIAKTVKHLYE